MKTVSLRSHTLTLGMSWADKRHADQAAVSLPFPPPQPPSALRRGESANRRNWRVLVSTLPMWNEHLRAASRSLGYIGATQRARRPSSGSTSERNACLASSSAGRFPSVPSLQTFSAMKRGWRSSSTARRTAVGPQATERATRTSTAAGSRCSGFPTGWCWSESSRSSSSSLHASPLAPSPLHRVEGGQGGGNSGDDLKVIHPVTSSEHTLSCNSVPTWPALAGPAGSTSWSRP